MLLQVNFQLSYAFSIFDNHASFVIKLFVKKFIAVGFCRASHSQKIRSPAIDSRSVAKACRLLSTSIFVSSFFSRQNGFPEAWKVLSAGSGRMSYNIDETWRWSYNPGDGVPLLLWFSYCWHLAKALPCDLLVPYAALLLDCRSQHSFSACCNASCSVGKTQSESADWPIHCLLDRSCSFSDSSRFFGFCPRYS